MKRASRKRIPFFARYLVKQQLKGVAGSEPVHTMKYPSDDDEYVTMKYPSDDDEFPAF
jgi:hypothetical protein